MPKTHTPESRGALVRNASANLGLFITEAESASRLYGSTAPEALSAWEKVETAGATIHRQARLLAGKSRGG